MWIPRTWEDLELALGVQLESDGLDFKSALPPKGKFRDIAKDAAAMSVGGGVILIGIDESDRVATEITPVPIQGAAERVQQIIDSNVAPALAVDITSLTENAGDSSGVLVVQVPASWSAPHQFDQRFPARSGATTRYLVEREIESLYARRAQLRQEAGASGGMQGFATPPGVRLSVDDGVGLMRLHVAPVTGARSSLEPHLGQALRRAVADAAGPLSEVVSPQFTPQSLDLLDRWSPAGTTGWGAGEFVSGSMPATILAGAMFSYGLGFSLSVAIDLSAHAGGPKDLCANEHHWVIEAMAGLCIAGRYFSQVPEASLLRVDLELGGLLDSVSWQASHGLAFNSDAPKVTENLYYSGGVFPAAELASDPRDAARHLLDPFMVAILTEGSDLVGWVKDQHY